MKKILILVCFLIAGVAQGQLWEDSFDSAVQKSYMEHKPIVLVFSGSDWCGPCIRFKKDILDSEVFSAYAKEHYVLYNADFPRKKKNELPLEKLNSNKTLAEKFNPRGHFPLVVVLDEQQKTLGTTGFDKKKSPEKYIDLFNGFVK